MLTRSLHAQVVLVLVILTVTLLAQLLITRGNLLTLSVDQKTIAHSYDNVGLVYELERDVIDLQRNLLIYKETASDTSIQRFYTIMERVEKNLVDFEEQVIRGSSLNIDKKLISRMSDHLNDYQDNFASVMNGRSKREEIIVEVNSLLNEIDTESDVIFKSQEKSLAEIHLLVSRMGQSFNGYLNSFDVDYIGTFKSESKKLNAVIEKTKGNHTNFYQTINKLNKRVIRLTHVTRGYIYLVNVVMAGSANEFLYLSEQMRKEVKNNQTILVETTDQSSKRIRLNNNIIALISITIVLLIAWFLSRRILLPIQGITNVFRVLSRGDEVGSIPSTDREDEVGDLAKAASVFHDKNKQTHELLERSQDMIANQEMMNIRLEEEKNKAEQAAESKSMFLANMSHEIRTPMNGIVGLVDLVLQTKLTDKQKNYLDRIAFSGHIMMNVINDILDFSKIEAGKMEIERVSFEVNSIIENLISAMGVRIREKQINFTVDVSKNVPCQLLGDPLRISQILLNLCSNAIKFTDQGSVKVGIDYIDGFIIFAVKDTGIGMSRNQLDTIFESFTQADGSTSRKYGGTGLGLTIVKQLVKLMKGEVKLESEENKGTQVYLKIKADQSSNDMAIDDLSVEDKTIMYLIDPELNQEECALTDQLMLKNYGLDIQPIILGENETLDLLQYTAPVIIQSDRIDFIKSHQDAIQQAVKLERHVGFIMLTNASKLKQYVYDQWRLPVLKHPFSPAQSKGYFLALYGQALPSQADEKIQANKHKYHGHVLLVEDNMINQLVAGDMLESLGLSYDIADNGQISIEKIEKNSEYNMIFMDVQMPVMDGYTATKTLREMGYSNLIICGLSANALTEDLSKAKEVGMNDYLTKPIQLTEMESVIKKYLNVQT